MVEKTVLVQLADELQQAADFPAYPLARYQQAAEVLKKLDGMSGKIADLCREEGIHYDPEDLLGSLDRLLDAMVPFSMEQLLDVMDSK